ncbi:MBL fold metallo-hydrolase [Pleionea mediterranea]|uniref:Glyoxylase-like metal-dependent hydrolase (Beta-lactamase superfamily II) n=1 Tax=Pleionea mediterranea TaxID=523701 RepID=A0A316G497_9GAMM|nr:MBL fold metallo-hydrolase [Pleionea mediterranea]PWK49227.1 glyoxylase-like metal-dependent hydrolase (beta-lactamase superfamily II) [Pleionea mediterranea]
MTKQLFSLAGNSQKLDGGAMFGNVPKAMWQNWVTVDEENRIDLSCRALLVKEPSRNILFETGIGAFFEPKYKQRFGVNEDDHILLDSLKQHGLTHEDIDIVVLSHMHFDHAGGLLTKYQENKEPELLFPNATYLVGAANWERANNPHFRDRASFLPVLNKLLEQSGRLVIVEGNSNDLLGEDYHFHYSDGHTPGMMLTEIATEKGPVVFAADLIPGAPWVHLPITMGYDRFPEHLIEEKSSLLGDLSTRDGWIYFTHDPEIACGKVSKNEKGRFQLSESYSDLTGW